jgi:hypothetical protein
MYNETGDLSHGEAAAKIGKKLEHIRKAKHHANEYANLRETDFGKAEKHMRASYAAMREAGITPPPAAATPATPASAQAQPAASAAPRNYETQTGEPAENKKRSEGLLAGLKEKIFGKAEKPGKPKNYEAKTNISRENKRRSGKAPKGEKAQPAEKTQKSQVENIQSELANQRTEEAVRNAKPELAAAPEASMSEARKKQMQEATGKESRKLVPDNIEGETKVPVVPAESGSAPSEEAIDELKKQFSKERAEAKPKNRRERREAARQAKSEQIPPSDEQKNDLARIMEAIGIK